MNSRLVWACVAAGIVAFALSRHYATTAPARGAEIPHDKTASQVLAAGQDADPLPGDGGPARIDASMNPGADSDGALSTAAPEAPEVEKDSVVDEEDFKWLRATTASEVLEQEADDLEWEIIELCRDDAFQRIAEGEYEIVKTDADGMMRLDSDREHLVEFYSSDSAQNTIRVVMPPPKYADAYALKQQQLWLYEMVRERKVALGPSTGRR